MCLLGLYSNVKHAGPKHRNASSCHILCFKQLVRAIWISFGAGPLFCIALTVCLFSGRLGNLVVFSSSSFVLEREVWVWVSWGPGILRENTVGGKNAAAAGDDWSFVIHANRRVRLKCRGLLLCGGSLVHFCVFLALYNVCGFFCGHHGRAWATYCPWCRTLSWCRM